MDVLSGYAVKSCMSVTIMRLLFEEADLRWSATLMKGFLKASLALAGGAFSLFTVSYVRIPWQWTVIFHAGRATGGNHFSRRNGYLLGNCEMREVCIGVVPG